MDYMYGNNLGRSKSGLGFIELLKKFQEWEVRAKQSQRLFAIIIQFFFCHIYTICDFKD